MGIVPEKRICLQRYGLRVPVNEVDGWCGLHYITHYPLLCTNVHGWNAQRGLPVDPEWPYPQYPPYGYGPPPWMPPYQRYPPPPSSLYGTHPASWDNTQPPMPSSYPYGGYARQYGAPSSQPRKSHGETGHVGSSESGGSKEHGWRGQAQCNRTGTVDVIETPLGGGQSLPSATAGDNGRQQHTSLPMAPSPAASPQVPYSCTYVFFG